MAIIKEQNQEAKYRNFCLKILRLSIIKLLLFYTAVRSMNNQRFCQHCEQQHSCQEVYRQLGNTKGPSIAFKVAAAFLLPITVFIAGLVVFERVLAGAIDTKGLQTAFVFLLALSAAFVCILITKAINKRFNKNQAHQI